MNFRCERFVEGPHDPRGLSTAPVLGDELLHFDRDAMEMTYRVAEGLPAMITKATNAWKVEAVTRASCQVVSVAETKLAWWAQPLRRVMARAVDEDLATVFEELRLAVEAAYACEVHTHSKGAA